MGACEESGMEISKTTQRAQGEEIKRIPIARCPVDGCGRTLLYSTDPKEKNTVTISVAKPDYQGTIKQVLPAEKQKEYGRLFVLLVTRLAPQGIVCYTL